MSVNITALGDLGKWDWNLFARVTSDIGTAGAAELMWNKKTRNAIIKGVKQVGKGMGKVLCPAADAFTKGDGAKGVVAAGGGYGVAAVAAASAVKGICPKKKKPEEPPKVEERRGVNPVVVGAVGVAAGLLLGALFSR